MPTPRDPAVTEYVRMRMRPIIDSKEMGTQKEIAARAGISEAYISSLWKTGVGGRSIDGFARILGFRNADELRTAAYDWWRQHGTRETARASDPAVIAALDVLKGLYPLVADAQWRLILARFEHPDFNERSLDYWITALGQEVHQDAMRATRAHNAQAQSIKEKRRDETRGARVVTEAFRDASRQKKRLKAIEAEKPLEKPPAEPPVAPAKKAL